MKILYVITDLALGGAEIQLLRMCKYVTENTSDQVCFVSLMDGEAEEMVETIKMYGIQYYSLGMKRGKASFDAYKKFIQLVKKINPDVIHSHMVHANFLVRFSKPFLGKVKIINTIHGEEEYNGRRKQIYKLTDNLADYTVACGKILFDQANAYGISSERRLKYICNGLDINEYSFDPEIRDSVRNELKLNDSFVWMNVARLSEVKNQRYLIKEFKNVYEKFQDVKLVLVGDGPLHSELVELTEKEQLTDNVSFLGQRDDVQRILCAADAFILSSINEGLPLSMQEAGAIGMPLVSTDVGGCNEMIKDGINGFLCESNKSGELGKAMMDVMECSRGRIEEMGRISHKIITDKFDMINVMKQWRDLYE